MSMDRRGPGRPASPVAVGGLLVGLTALAFLLPFANQRLIQQTGFSQALGLELAAGHALFVADGSPYVVEDLASSAQVLQGELTQLQDEALTEPYDRPVWGLAPFALLAVLPADWVLAIWLSLAQVSLPLIVWASLRLAGWRPEPRVSGSLMLASFLWYYGAQAVLSGTPTALAVGLVVGSMAIARSGLDFPAGLLLALAGFEPWICLLGLVFLTVWGAVGRRWLLVATPWLGLAGLSVLSWSWLPGWPVAWLSAVVSLRQAGQDGSLVLDLVNGPLGLLLVALLAVLLLWQWAVTAGKGQRWFGWAASLTLAIGYPLLAVPKPASALLLLPGLFMCVGVWLDRWRRTGALMALVLGLALLAVPWASFALLPTASGDIPPWLLWFPWLLVFPALWWVRWWAAVPAQLPETGWTEGRGPR